MNKGGRLRFKVKINPKTGRWYCARLDGRGRELEHSPEGSAQDAARFEDNARRFGAWQRS